MGCRKDPIIEIEEPELVMPFNGKFLEGNYSGIEDYYHEHWRYFGGISESHWSTWDYNNDSTIHDATCLIEYEEGNILKITAGKLEAWYPTFSEALIIDSTLSFSEAEYNVTFNGANSDSLIINLTRLHTYSIINWISYTQESYRDLSTFRYLLKKD